MTTKEIQDRAEAAKHAPISLPAGSYSIEDLEKVAKAAVSAKPEARAALVDEQLEKVNQTFTDRPDQGLEPGMKYVEREHEELGVVERIQVRAKPAGETEEETAEIDAKVASQNATPGAAAADKE